MGSAQQQCKLGEACRACTKGILDVRMHVNHRHVPNKPMVDSCVSCVVALVFRIDAEPFFLQSAVFHVTIKLLRAASRKWKESREENQREINLERINTIHHTNTARTQPHISRLTRSAVLSLPRKNPNPSFFSGLLQQATSNRCRSDGTWFVQES